MKQTKERQEEQLNQMLFHRKEVLEELLFTKLLKMEYEKSYKGMYIDLFAYDKTKKAPVFIEVQKYKMDLVHFRKIEELIQKIDEGIIIWISTKSAARFIKRLEILALSMKKNLELFFIEIEEDVLFLLNDLQSENSVDGFNLIKSRQFSPPRLKIKSRITVGHGFTQNLIPNDFYKGNEKVNRELLSRLRSEYPYFGNALRSKSNLDRSYIQMGSGFSNIEILLKPIPSKTKEAKLELRLTNSASLLTLQRIQDELQSMDFSSQTSTEKKRFVVHYGTDLSTALAIEKIVEDFGKLIKILNHLSTNHSH